MRTLQQKNFKFIFKASAIFFLLCFLNSDLLSQQNSNSEYSKFRPKESIVYPIISAEISSKYGKRKHPIYKTSKHHEGVDLAVPEGSHVRSILPGTVIYSGTWGGYGQIITILHRDGYTSSYGHLSKTLVKVGQHIRAGHVIGRVGSTGRSTGPHLHFEWRYDSKSIDPLKVFPELTEEASG